MASPGPLPISSQDASELLQRLITESIKSRLVFVSAGREIFGFATGVARRSPDGSIEIGAGLETDGGFLRFDPFKATGFSYADNRGLPLDTAPGSLRFVSALNFIYPDQSCVTVLEIAD